MSTRAISFLLALSSVGAYADDTSPAASEPPPEQAEGDTGQSENRFSVEVDLTTVSQYFYRGIVQETDGFIFQPSITIGVDLFENDGWALSGFAGMWNSFHSEETGSSDPDQFVSTWYEVDFYTGLTLTHERISLDVCYLNYASPNNAFGSINELGVCLELDDAGLWGGSDFALNPCVTLAFELGDNSGDGGVDRGVFLGIGIEPGMEISGSPLGEIAMSFPIEAGFSISDYYELAGDDEAFGYLSAGVAASVPLRFMPEGYGEWSFNTGIDYLLLGDHTQSYNGGDDSEWIAHAGVSFEF